MWKGRGVCLGVRAVNHESMAIYVLVLLDTEWGELLPMIETNACIMTSLCIYVGKMYCSSW